MKTKFNSHPGGNTGTASFIPAVGLAMTLLTPLSAQAQTMASPDYDGDGSADVTFRRASSFETIVKRSSDGSTQRVTFGRSAGDIPVYGDFDGDNITDIAVRRASNQTWYILNSSGVDKISGNSDGITRKRFGLQTGDIPVVADYDGDGMTDLAVRRPSNRTWYILNSSGIDRITGHADGITRRRFGLSEEDIPVPADYDGDGRADLAVRRPSNYTWYILNSSGVDYISNNDDGITRRGFGLNESDIPVPADYDGDGKADLAVRRASNQHWYVLNSSGTDLISGNSDGITRRGFGLRSSDIPTPADYDGDGKADLAVRRAQTNQWFVLNSTGIDSLTGNNDGITRLTFGNQTTDMPVSQPAYQIWLSSDIDVDGLTFQQEQELDTDFTNSDTDGDGLNDGAEVNTHGTDPKDSDTDNDDLSDSAEINEHNTNPKDKDSDNDGLEDGEEINQYSTNPRDADSDNDGLNDGAEINIHNTDPNNADTDGDGTNDGDEVAAGTDPNEADTAVEFSESALITSVVDTIYIPTFQTFADKARALNSAVSSYCAALPNDSGNKRATAQNQWKTTMDTWQMAEMMQVGPLLFNGNELRDEVYSWPNNRACFVDRSVVAAEQPGYNISNQSPANKGLDALEYLLFDNDLDHKCSVAGPDGWNQRSDADRIAARCSFASLVAEDVVNNANKLVSDWTGQQGYGTVLKAAGSAGSQFDKPLDAINDISDGLFYFTGKVKDGKIAAPVGLRVNNCGLTPCPQDAESVYADHSLENIINNMKALRMLLAGRTEREASFVDFLIESGDANTANNIITQLDEAINAAEQLTAPYSRALTETPAQVEQLHDEVNDVDNILKGDFLKSLALELPSTSAGDND